MEVICIYVVENMTSLWIPWYIYIFLYTFVVKLIWNMYAQYVFYNTYTYDLPLYYMRYTNMYVICKFHMDLTLQISILFTLSIIISYTKIISTWNPIILHKVG